MNAAKEYNADETCTSPFIALHCFLSEVDSFKKVYRKSTGSIQRYECDHDQKSKE